jgi:acetolactate decarboxylase
MRISIARLALGLLLLVAGCDRGRPVAAPPSPAPHPDRLTQVNVINALMLGGYDGVMSLGELLRHGDLGLGTLDGLDGELIVLDGRAYQARGDGAVVAVPPNRTTPFATVIPFRPDGEVPLAGLAGLAGLAALDARLDAAIGRANHFVALRADVALAVVTVRSVPRQDRPYRPLAQVAQAQRTWTHRDVRGTLVGTRGPSWSAGLNVPGYHWHFLSDDRRVGGHVLDLRLTAGRVRYDVAERWEVRFPGAPGFDALDLARDQRADLHRVESGRAGEAPPAAPPPR